MLQLDGENSVLTWPSSNGRLAVRYYFYRLFPLMDKVWKTIFCNSICSLVNSNPPVSLPKVWRAWLLLPDYSAVFCFDALKSFAMVKTDLHRGLVRFPAFLRFYDHRPLAINDSC